jgi:hypothetical protein
MKNLLFLCLVVAGLYPAQDVLLSDINPSNFNQDFLSIIRKRHYSVHRSLKWLIGMSVILKY